MIPGIDVSHWQNDIDWREVKRSGVRFAFIKATEFPDRNTSLFIDNKLQVNILGATENGIYWGAYHFFRTHIDPIIQAQAFCETVQRFSSLPPVLDLEVAGTKGERLNHKVEQFLEEVERITSRLPIIYTSGGFWRSYLAYEKRAHTDWARKYPLWIAHYTNQWPAPLYPWAGWDFWQYSDSGKLPGIKTNVDLNWYNGSEDELTTHFVETNNRVSVSLADSAPQDGSGEDSHAKSSTFKGDYQEPLMGRAQGHHPSAKYTPQQDEWIRTYFFNNH